VTDWAWAGLSVIGAVLLAALGDLVSEEIRGWLDLVPRAILRVAATQLDPAQRETIYQDEWLPELCYALRGAESRPITRLILGTYYAAGILISARRVARRLNRSLPAAVSTPEALYYVVSATNGTGHSVPIRNYNIALSNGNTYEEFTTEPEKVIAELRAVGLFATRRAIPGFRFSPVYRPRVGPAI
jgi:hypothetical protein